MKKANLKTKLDSNISAVGDLKKEFDESKKEVDDLQKANSYLKQSSKKDVDKLNDKVKKLKEDKKGKRGNYRRDEGREKEDARRNWELWEMMLWL